ncbi:MAG: cupin domain-containing protein [Gemmatimonadota bacterium]|jgi:mannose-6-phosphate isomerase-like protein (cupin superfamily)
MMVVPRFVSGGCKARQQWVAMLVMVLCTGLCSCSHAEGQQDDKVPAGPTTVVMGPDDGDHLWVFAESKDTLGSGGDFQIYVDPVTFPEASASFAKFGLGVGGALPVHRHDKTEEIGYFLAGQGVVTVYEDGVAKDIPVQAGHVVYVPPGSWHTIRNTGQEPFSLVFATIPNEKKGLLSFFREIGVKPGSEAAPLSPDDFAKLASEHDLILRPPDAAK